MAFLAPRKSRGINYWSIVESKRVNGKPRNIILEYLGTADSLLNRLRDHESISLTSWSHGDTTTLLKIAEELDVVNIINKHVSPLQNSKTEKPMRDGLTVGASFLLAAIGRACHPTSKMGWYEWCQKTSLQHSLKRSLKKLTSQHFWDQMHSLPIESIAAIEEELVKKVLCTYAIKLDCLLFDTTNFFTFIDSKNTHCDIPQRGKNKQKRYDLRQIGMALLVTRQDQLPLFHKTYQGNKNDITVFKEVFVELISRMKGICQEMVDITIVFDKGNNSKQNFDKIDQQQDLYYVGGLVPSYFKELIKKANKNFSIIKINKNEDEEIPVYRVKEKVWGEERTCIVSISKQLKEGQIAGIHQHLGKKCKVLEGFKQQLENPRSRKKYKKKEIETKLKKTIKGQFIDEILKYEIIKLKKGFSFTYFIDNDSFDKLKREILGRKILVTNRHDWTSEEIILAYRGQAKVEYGFRKLKNVFHCAVRPQYHWTDQKIESHFLMCIIGYLLTTVAYSKARKEANYKRNMSHFLDDLNTIRLGCFAKKKSRRVKYQLETIPSELKKVAQVLSISNETIHPNINYSGYK